MVFQRRNHFQFYHTIHGMMTLYNLILEILRVFERLKTVFLLCFWIAKAINNKISIKILFNTLHITHHILHTSYTLYSTHHTSHITYLYFRMEIKTIIDTLAPYCLIIIQFKNVRLSPIHYYVML